MGNTKLMVHERDGAVLDRSPIRVSADVPEIVLIEGDLRSGKTLYMVEAVYQLYDSRTPGIYANFTIHGLPNLQVLKNVTHNTLLGIPPKSIAAFSEIYHLFDKRTSMKKDQVKNTQALQQIGKCQYKLLVDCFEGNLLDFRFMEQVTDIIHSWGPIEQILEKNHYRNIPQNTLAQMLSILTPRNYQHIFLYEYCNYDKAFEEVRHSGAFFLLDGSKIFDRYETHALLNRNKTLMEFGGKT